MGDEERTFTQDDVNALVGQARQEARQKAQEQFKAELAKAAEEQARDKDEWRKLAEDRMGQLEPLQEKVEKYDEVVQGMLDARIEALDAGDAIDALPAVMSPLDKLNWLNRNASLFEGREPSPGTPRKPLRTQGPSPQPERRRRVTL